MQTENKIEPIHDFEVGTNQSMCEIRFDCTVKMYEMGTRKVKEGFFVQEEKPLNPQWFKSQHTITLDGIRNCDEYTLGRKLKEMFYQLENHIRKYEE